MLGTPGAQKTPGRVRRKAAGIGVFEGLGQMWLSEDDLARCGGLCLSSEVRGLSKWTAMNLRPARTAE